MEKNHDCLGPGPDSIMENASGFVLLAGAILYANGKGISYEKMKISPVSPQEEQFTVVRHLGTGAFANAFEIGEEEFMKVPLSASQAKSLEREAAILKALGDIDELPESIPRLANHQAEDLLSDLRVTIRDEVSSIKGLRLKGIIGVSLNKFQKEFCREISKIVVEQVYRALQAAHAHNIYHLDVRPGNIILKYNEDHSNAKVMLSDWGCATSEKKLKHFRGCTPYADDAFLGRLDLNVRVGPELDFASLVYTIVHVTEGRLPWLCEFDLPRTVTTDDMRKRKEFVEKWFQEKSEAFLPTDSRGILKGAVLSSRNSSRQKRTLKDISCAS